MSKYYTPEIEEFHVGFEFEEFYNDVWNQRVYISGYFMDYDMSCRFGKEKDKIRVKYLDREDIESTIFYFDENGCYHDRWADKSLFHSDGENKVMIKIKGDTVFHGTIKNKSELKKLLKQLGI